MEMVVWEMVVGNGCVWEGEVHGRTLADLGQRSILAGVSLVWVNATE